MLDSTCVIKAVAIRPEGKTKVYVDSVTFNKATCCDITLAMPPSRSFAGNGAATLVDGKFGTHVFADGNWLGFQGTDLDAVIDFGADRTISSVAVRNYVETGSWIYDTPRIVIEGSSDGKTFVPVAEQEFPADTQHVSELRNHRVEFAPQSVRYLRVKVGKCASDSAVA